MVVFITALLVWLTFAVPAAACMIAHIPKPDELRFADTVAKVVLRKVEAGLEQQYFEANFSSAFLVFETLKTYRGPQKETWRVIWRRGHADRVLSLEARPEGGGSRPLADADRDPFFDKHGRYYYFHANPGRVPEEGRLYGPTLIIGEEYIVGIVPAEKQFSGRGCTKTRSHVACFADGEGGYHDELQADYCGIAFPYAFPFSDLLEARVIGVLAEAE